MSSERLLSLDALRGFTIIGMVIVNSPGSWSHVYPPLLHASWHGLTPTDLVFPFFLFMVGVSIALAFSKRLRRREPKGVLYRKIAWRAGKIFALGLFLSLWPAFDFADLRIAGVLQRIAIVFAVCSILFLNTGWRSQALVAAGILFAYWGALRFAPVPIDAVNAAALASGQVERSYGTLEPVAIAPLGPASLKPNYEPGVNLAAWVDRKLLPGRFWERSWDPEGLASTLPACATGILGMLAGSLILAIGDPYRRIAWLFFAGFASLIVGYIWSWDFPLNKNLWSSSFTLVAAGLAALCLAACLLLIDTLGYRRWAQAGIIYGANAVVAYALSSLLVVVFYGDPWGMGSLSEGFMGFAADAGFPLRLASLLYALLFAAVVFAPVWWLWRRKIFLRL